MLTETKPNIVGIGEMSVQGSTLDFADCRPPQLVPPSLQRVIWEGEVLQDTTEKANFS